MRAEGIIGTVKASVPTGYLAGWFWGVEWGVLASFVAFVWTSWLIGEKAYKSYKAWQAKRQA